MVLVSLVSEAARVQFRTVASNSVWIWMCMSIVMNIPVLIQHYTLWHLLVHGVEIALYAYTIHSCNLIEGIVCNMGMNLFVWDMTIQRIASTIGNQQESPDLIVTDPPPLSQSQPIVSPEHEDEERDGDCSGLFPDNGNEGEQSENEMDLEESDEEESEEEEEDLSSLATLESLHARVQCEMGIDAPLRPFTKDEVWTMPRQSFMELDTLWTKVYGKQIDARLKQFYKAFDSDESGSEELTGRFVVWNPLNTNAICGLEWFDDEDSAHDMARMIMERTIGPFHNQMYRDTWRRETRSMEL